MRQIRGIIPNTGSVSNNFFMDGKSARKVFKVGSVVKGRMPYFMPGLLSRYRNIILVGIALSGIIVYIVPIESIVAQTGRGPPPGVPPGPPDKNPYAERGRGPPPGVPPGPPDETPGRGPP